MPSDLWEIYAEPGLGPDEETLAPAALYWLQLSG
jgi:hypothetical protein